MSKSNITTHVLDTALGQPAANVPIGLFALVDGQWLEKARTVTDSDGRILQWGLGESSLPLGTYKLCFELAAYYGEASFYPFAEVVFQRLDDRHHHIPLLISPFGYSTYRGS